MCTWFRWRWAGAEDLLCACDCSTYISPRKEKNTHIHKVRVRVKVRIRVKVRVRVRDRVRVRVRDVCRLSFVFCLGYLDRAAAAGRSPSWRPAAGSVGALASSAVEGQDTVPVAHHHLRINELVLGLG